MPLMIGRSLGRPFSFIKEVVKQHYNVAHHRVIAPVDENERDPGQFSWLGQAPLFFPLPLIPFTYLVGFVVAPFGYHSWRVFKTTVPKISRIPMFDFSKQEENAEENPQQNPEEITHPWFAYPYGFMGILSAFVVGIPIATIALGVRILTNTVKSFVESFKWVANKGKQILALTGEEVETFDETAFKPKGWFARILGTLGYVPGALVGGLFSIGVDFLCRGIIKNSAFTLFHMISLSGRAIFLPNEPAKQDERASGQYFGLGFLGVLAGTLLMSPVLAVASVFKLGESLETGKRLWNSTVGKWLNDEAPSDTLQNDGRDWVRQYILGCWGVLGYGVAAVVGGSFFSVGYTILQTAYSYGALAGSFMNGGLGRPQFGGLASEERRSPWAKLIGSFGYLLATLTAFPVSSLIFIVRRSPMAAFYFLGILASPFLLLGNGISLWRNPRYPQMNVSREVKVEVESESNEEESDSEEEHSASAPIKETRTIVEKFPNMNPTKDLNSEIGPGGDFTGVPSTRNDGGKGTFCYIRQAFTLNADSVAEVVIREFRANPGLANAAADQQQLITRLQEESDNCFLDQNDDKAVRDQEIQDTVTYVAARVRMASGGGLEHCILPNYQSTFSRWKGAFWGRSEEPVTPGPGLVSLPRPSHGAGD